MTDRFPRRTAVWAGAAALLALSPLAAHAQLRVATWNISDYDGSDRTTALKTAVYGQFNCRSMAPDVFTTQEFMSQTAVNSFLSILNTATNSPGDWAAATFVNGPDTDSAFFYRTSKVNFVSDTIILNGGTGSTPPRDVHRYDVTLKGYAGTAPLLSLYSVHMKAGTSGSGTTGDEGRRQTEANAIRTNAQSLGHAFLIGGDFNTPSFERRRIRAAGRVAHQQRGALRRPDQYPRKLVGRQRLQVRPHAGPLRRRGHERPLRPHPAQHHADRRRRVRLHRQPKPRVQHEHVGRSQPLVPRLGQRRRAGAQRAHPHDGQHDGRADDRAGDHRRVDHRRRAPADLAGPAHTR
jgi:hypothetical protein